jgi:uncharacterized membrane protein YecN with MAPEG domain
LTFYTAWIAAPLMLIVAVLGLRISGLRLGGVARSKEKPDLDRFARWQRAHGNAVEHVPLVLLLMLMLELASSGGRSIVLWLGVPFVLSRLMHAYGTILPSKWPKFIGASLTYAVELAVGALLLVKMVQRL